MKTFENYCQNLKILSTAKSENLNNPFIISGIIRKFFIQFDLSWKVLKELIKYEGKNIANSGSPREIIKAAYSMYSFIDEDTWLSMLKARNDMSHIYDGNAARNLVNLILDSYIPEFIKLKNEIQAYYGDILDNL